MFLSLCDKGFHVCLHIPAGGLVCGTEPSGEHAKAASVSFTQDQGQLPGDKGFLFAFVRVVQTFVQLPRQGQQNDHFVIFTCNLNGPRPHQTPAGNKVRETVGTHTKAQTSTPKCFYW